MTTLEMQAMEQHLETVRKQKAIRRILLQSHFTTCDTCNKTYFPMFTLHGYGLCPDCDHEVIEKYQDRMTTRSLRGLIAS